MTSALPFAATRPPHLGVAAVPTSAESAATPLQAALAVIGFGVSVYDDESTLVYENAAAQAMCRARDDDDDDDGHDSAARTRLAEARTAGLRGERRLVERVTWKGTTFSAVVPMTVKGRTWITVIEGRGQACGPLELQLFCAQHRLSYAESKVLHELVKGMRAADIAAAHGVAQTTVITQIVSIRSKTVTKSLRDLLDKVARLPPLSARPLQPSLSNFE